MAQNKNMTIADKIKAIRNQAGLSQDDLAKVIARSKSTISRIEDNEYEYTDEQLTAIKAFFKIEDAPLTDKEIKKFKTRLYAWRDAVIAGRMEEAGQMRDKLSVITEIPFEKDLLFLYRMLEVNFLLQENSLASAGALLEQARNLVDDVDNENQFHFYFNMSSLNFRKEDYEGALQNLFIADKLKPIDKKTHHIQHAMATCYERLGKYVRAIAVLNQIYPFYENVEANIEGMRLFNAMGNNYINIGELGLAREFLERTLEIAEAIENNTYIGFALHNLGCVCVKEKDFERALKYFNDAFKYKKEGTRHYFENLYFEIYCLIAIKHHSSKQRLAHAKSISASEGNKHYNSLFDPLEHLLNIKGNTSLQHIGQTTITYLFETREYCKALDYCELLEEIFSKRNSKLKSLEVAALHRDIQKKILHESGVMK